MEATERNQKLRPSKWRMTCSRRSLRLITLISVLAVYSPSSVVARFLYNRPRNMRRNAQRCPPCDMLFSKLEQMENGKKFQHVEIQERGEPKSGTGFMLEWAGGALMHTCDYLKRSFGDASCEVTWSLAGDKIHDLKHMTMTFKPGLAVKKARCPCAGIDSVIITLQGGGKHRLPMSEQNCSLVHSAGIPGKGDVCTFPDGRQPQNYNDLWRCVREANCPIIDDQQQMVVFRDPRPLVVSAYFYLVAAKRAKLLTIDEYVETMLPTYAQWVAVRYIIFEGYMTSQSTFFWYDEAMADPLAWHHQWLAAVGLQLPNTLIEVTKDAAVRHEFAFPTKGVDPHPGSQPTGHVHRSYQAEVSPRTLVRMDSILQQWLPPPLLAKFKVPLADEVETPTSSPLPLPVSHMQTTAVEGQTFLLFGTFVCAVVILVKVSCVQRKESRGDKFVVHGRERVAVECNTPAF